MSEASGSILTILWRADEGVVLHRGVSSDSEVPRVRQLCGENRNLCDGEGTSGELLLRRDWV